MRLGLALIAATTLGIGALAAVPPAAQAAPAWTLLNTGTAVDINNADSQGAFTAFTTVDGKIHVKQGAGAFVETDSRPGVIHRDLAVSPSGTGALALFDNTILRWNGATWEAPDLTGVALDLAVPGTTYPNGYCPANPGAPGTYPAADLSPRAELMDVEWTSDTVAYVSVGNVESSVLKTTDAGLTWQEVGRDSAGNCLLDGVMGADLEVTGSTIWLLYRRAHYRSVDAMATVQPLRSGQDHSWLAVDPTNPLRQASAAAGGTNYSHLTVTADQWADADYVNRDSSVYRLALRALVAAPGKFYAVGDNGRIDRFSNGSDVEQLSVPGRTTTTWYDASVNSSGHLLLAGAGGTLALSTNPAAVLGGNGGDGSGLPPKNNPPVQGGAVQVKGKRVMVKVKGKLARPAGVSKAAGCKGVLKAKIKAKKGNKFKNVKNAKVKVKKNCKFKKKIKVNKSAVGNAKRLRLVLKLTKNPALGKLKSTYTVPIRR